VLFGLIFFFFGGGGVGQTFGNTEKQTKLYDATTNKLTDWCGFISLNILNG
jgi:hypothetical protein